MRFAFLWMVGGSLLAACGSSETKTTNDTGVVLTGAGGAASAISADSSADSASSSDSTSSPASSASAGAMGSGGKGAGGMATGGVGGGAPICKDNAPGEPNPTESLALSLKDKPATDCDKDGGSLSGVIKGKDVDWYSYQGNDDFFCSVDPSRTLNPTDKGLRLCKYLECLNGIANTEVTCPSGTTADKSPDGRPGCCGSKGFTADLNCKGSGDDVAYVYIRVDAPAADASTCIDYTVDYHY